MSETQNQQSNEEKPTEGTPPSDQAGKDSGAAPALEQTGFKWGESAPKEWQGKTAAEAAAQYQQLVQSVREYVQRNQTATPPATPKPAEPQMSESELKDLWYENPEKAQQVLRRQIEQQLGSQIGQALGSTLKPLYEAQAQSARETAARDNKEIFEKYGAEIDSIAANLPLAQRANPQMYKEIVKVVKGNHLDEIAAEKAAALAASGTFGVESSAGGGAGTSGGSTMNSYIDKMRESDYGKHLIEKYGEAGMVRKLEQLEKSQDAGFGSAKEFVESVAKSTAFRDPDLPGTITNKGIARNVNAK